MENDRTVHPRDAESSDAAESSLTNVSFKDFNYSYASSYATLETLIDDCLREIFRYLNLLDATSLASACSRLLDFANSDIFPKTARAKY